MFSRLGSLKCRVCFKVRIIGVWNTFFQLGSWEGVWNAFFMLGSWEGVWTMF